MSFSSDTRLATSIVDFRCSFDRMAASAGRGGTHRRYRISVHAVGVSFANPLFIAGKHQNRPSFPFILGTAGLVAEIASDSRTSLRVGDRVCASLPPGGFAEEAIVDAANALKIADALSFAGATLFPTIYATAFAGLTWRGNLKAGETLLVHGAAEASGLAADKFRYTQRASCCNDKRDAGAAVR